MALALALATAASAFTLADLPKPEVGFGFFYSPGRCQYANETLYLADMRDHGCNTFAPQAQELPGQSGHTAAQNLARQLNNAAAIGLTDPRIPVVCYSVGPEDLVAAKALREPGLEWPELVVQSIDEPNHTQEKYLREYRDAAHAAGLRIGTAVAGYVCTGYTDTEGKPVPGMGGYLDLWVCLVGTWTEATRQAAQAQGADFGAYLAYPSSALLDRWTFGLWAWRARVRTVLLWAYVDKQAGWDYGRVAETPNGPVYGSAGAGYAEGITDYRVLQAVRDLGTDAARGWLESVEARVPLGWWPRGYVKDEQHLEVPPVDMDEIRAEGMALLQ